MRVRKPEVCEMAWDHIQGSTGKGAECHRINARVPDGQETSDHGVILR